jgi:uncharacterized protein YdeI (YjbR/CyaY-like superfamily)
MGKRDPHIDAYIAKAAEFARPILRHLRELVHQGCPSVQETFKWSMPAFEYRGLLCQMAAFKHHATFGFWKHELVVGKREEQAAMGQFGRLTSLRDLPADESMLGYMRKAAELNAAGIKAPSKLRPKPGRTRDLALPGYFVAALKKNERARKNFDSFSYSHRKEYVEWLTEAKREETRQRRLEKALAMLAQNKPRNWKYLTC